MVVRIVESLHPNKIVLFGSYAWGKPNEDSDIDLFIIVDSSGEPEYRRARKVYRCLRGVPVPIDVIVKTTNEVRKSAKVVSSLTRKILEEGKVLYG
jgi:predicted nucleotidyltransferase